MNKPWKKNPNPPPPPDNKLIHTPGLVEYNPKPSDSERRVHEIGKAECWLITHDSGTHARPPKTEVIHEPITTWLSNNKDAFIIFAIRL